MTDFPQPPADAPEHYTLEQAFIDLGQGVPERVECPHCGLGTRAFAVIVVDDIPDDCIPGTWACSNCRQDYFRDTAAPPPRSLDDVRAERNLRLARCDWTQLPDVPEATRTAWQDYRQALRDVPDGVDDPNDVTWPAEPVSA